MTVHNFQTTTANYFAAGILVHNCDLHARHAWLVGRKDSLQAQLEGDPDFFDAKVAGWWVWGLCLWIGSGWCTGKGPWHVVDGRLVRSADADADGGVGTKRKLVHLGNAGRGINRQLVHLGNAGQGINRQREGDTCEEWSDHLRDMMAALSDRLRRVRVCCGDWSRVCGPTPTVKQGLTAVFLDPPYGDTAGREPDIYSRDSFSVAHDVREWAIEWGDDPRMRIALCGYESEHVMPDSWECVWWKAKGGYGLQAVNSTNTNARRERIWFSPHCLRPCLDFGDATPLLAGMEAFAR